MTNSVADEIKKLKNLFDSGVITGDEFEAQKKKLLGNSGANETPVANLSPGSIGGSIDLQTEHQSPLPPKKTKKGMGSKVAIAICVIAVLGWIGNNATKDSDSTTVSSTQSENTATTAMPTTTKNEPSTTELTTTEPTTISAFDEWEANAKANFEKEGWTYTPVVDQKKFENMRQDAVLLDDYLELHKQYMDNPIAADGSYKGKTMLFMGKVDEIDREILGNPYVTFPVDGFLENVRVTFQKSEEEKFASISKGREIFVMGICRGTLMGTSVAFDDCLLIGVGP